MKKILAVVAASVISGSALAAGQGASERYLIDHSFKTAPSEPTRVVELAPFQPRDSAEAYVVESRLVSAEGLEIDSDHAGRNEGTSIFTSPVKQMLYDWGFTALPEGAPELARIGTDKGDRG